LARLITAPDADVDPADEHDEQLGQRDEGQRRDEVRHRLQLEAGEEVRVDRRVDHHEHHERADGRERVLAAQARERLARGRREAAWARDGRRGAHAATDRC
jgi:hypothetical protein